MGVFLYPVVDEEIVYPESDGQPMAENTLQFQWIVTIKENLEALYWDEPHVFVAGDFLWYPVKGRPDIRRAPDAMVVLGRPKGHRGAYLQWKEEHVAPQVVFEVLSPGNTAQEMHEKFGFYERYGVEEYYVYDPDHNRLEGWQRVGGDGGQLQEIVPMNGWVSPRLGIRFVLTRETLLIYTQDGERFLTFTEIKQQLEDTERRLDDAERRVEEERRARKQLLAQLQEKGIDISALGIGDA
jgi:Uma2 family endonuclease